MSNNGFFHPIKVVSLRTGLSPHLIRVWERRYGAVTPGRTGSQRRMYSEQEIERLKLLQLLTEAGHSIGNIANMGTDELQLLRGEGDSPRFEALKEAVGLEPREVRREWGRQFVERCLTAVTALDQAGLESALQEGAVALGQQGALVHVVAPLAEEVGVKWQEGTIGVSHEHFASAILRTFLGQMSRPFAASESAPEILTATPTSQLHELGAMLITAAAAVLGWRATYLGASLGPQEIAGAVRQKSARAVGLSIVYPPDDAGVAAELRRLKPLLPEDVTILVGGRAASSYRSVIDEIGAVFSGGSLNEFMDHLNRLREGRGERSA